MNAALLSSFTQMFADEPLLSAILCVIAALVVANAVVLIVITVKTKKLSDAVKSTTAPVEEAPAKEVSVEETPAEETVEENPAPAPEKQAAEEVKEEE